MLRAAVLIVLLAFAPLTAAAQNRTAPLVEALQLEEILRIMREEGLGYGEELAEDMFPGRGGSVWSDTVSQIYDFEAMRDTMVTAFEAEMEDVDIEPLTEFFTSDLGRQIIALEVSAREAFLDDTIEEASNARAAQLQEQDDPRYQLVREFIDANDLVETNVVGALNSNYAFYLGLIDGGSFPYELTEDQIIADVWGQENEIRDNTTEWLYSYLLLAYQPLDDDELQRYLELSQTEEGQAMNRALFAGFDLMFVKISRALGLSVSRYMGGEEL